jgi:hypothetical protein
LINRQNSTRINNLAFQVAKRKGVFAPAGGRSRWVLVALLAPCMFVFSQALPLRAQQHKSKVPIVGKLSSGNLQQAYSGKIQSLDLKQKVLNVNSLHGQDSEIFPIKKNVRVESLDGGRMKLDALTPGMTVLIYYDQKSGARTVKNIIVLSSGKSQEKGKLAPSS